MQQATLLRQYQQLEPVTAGTSRQRRGNRPPALQSLKVRMPQEVGHALQLHTDSFGIGPIRPDQGCDLVRRQASIGTLTQLLFGKGVVAIGQQSQQCRVIRMVRLYQYLAGSIRAPCSTGHLHQLLSKTLRPSEITGEQPLVGIDDTHQGDPREVVTLNQHLCAHDNSGLTIADARQSTIQFTPFSRGIPIKPLDTEFGEQSGQDILKLLGPQAAQGQ